MDAGTEFLMATDRVVGSPLVVYGKGPRLSRSFSGVCEIDRGTIVLDPTFPSAAWRQSGNVQGWTAYKAVDPLPLPLPL